MAESLSCLTCHARAKRHRGCCWTCHLRHTKAIRAGAAAIQRNKSGRPRATAGAVACHHRAVAVEGNTVNPSARRPWVIAAGIVAGCLILALHWGRPADAQPPKRVGPAPGPGIAPKRVGPAPRAEARPVAAAPLLPSGRYQLATGRDSANPNASVLYLVDTATGRVWYARGAAAKDGGVTYRWAEMVPALPAKER
jgi:hypothetical protein